VLAGPPGGGRGPPPAVWVLGCYRVGPGVVRDEERGLWRDGLRRGRIGSVVDDLPGRVLDLEDDPRRHVGATVRERAVGRGEVDRADLDGADRAGEAGLEEAVRPAGEADPELFGALGDGLVADALERPD